MIVGRVLISVMNMQKLRYNKLNENEAVLLQRVKDVHSNFCSYFEGGFIML